MIWLYGPRLAKMDFEHALSVDSHHLVHVQGFIPGLCSSLINSIVSNDSDSRQRRPRSDLSTHAP